MRYIKHEDPGHGWLEVGRHELERLAIRDDISSYSYQRGDRVYLEEDCDMTTFLEALNKKQHDDNCFEDIHINYVHTDSSHWIRGLRSYQPKPVCSHPVVDKNSGMCFMCDEVVVVNV